MGAPFADTHLNLILNRARPRFGEFEQSLQGTVLRRGQTLHRRGETITQLVFPRSAVISLVTRAAPEGSMETGLIGREGCAGTEALLGAGTALTDAIVQVPGRAVVAPVGAVKTVFDSEPSLRDGLLRHLRALLAQLMQSVICNRLHGAEARCSRWLLMVHDRAGSDELALTQEYLAEMLGVRRPTITLVLAALEKAGLIGSARGRILVLDRQGLERAACACYRATRAALDDVGLGLSAP